LYQGLVINADTFFDDIAIIMGLIYKFGMNKNILWHLFVLCIYGRCVNLSKIMVFKESETSHLFNINIIHICKVTIAGGSITFISLGGSELHEIHLRR
jgi:hypothetical protein